MTTTQERVLAAIERWDRQQASRGHVRCPECGDWHSGRGVCAACDETRPMVTIAMVVGLALLAK